MSRSSEDPLLQIVHAKEVQNKTYAYHAHDYREVLTVLGSTDDGLIDSEVTKRRNEYGKNEFTPAKKITWFERLFSQLKSPFAFVLVMAFGITFGLAEYIDAFVIAFALLIAVGVGVLQEGKASRAFEKLANSQKNLATVLRNGKKHQVEAAELVPGDVVILQSGSQVPADVRLVHAKQLAINEATLTGEWIAVEKSTDAVAVGTPFAEQTSMGWMGTFVAQGYGMGAVTATGDATAVGVLAESMRDVEEVDTPLQGEMKKISNIMLYIIGTLVLFIFIIGLVQGQSLHDMLLMSIAIAVASVPEGLPAAVTIILAVGMEALLNRGGLVRNLLAAETLGSTTYVLTDKTGTLTQAVMSVTDVLVEDGVMIKSAAFGEHEHVRKLFDVSLAAADAYTEEKNGASVVHGDAVEVAVLEAAASISISEFDESLRAERFDYLAFTSEQRFAAGLVELPNETFQLCVNGSPELIVEKASSVLKEDGREEVLHDEARVHLSQAIEKFTLEGKRLIGVGYKKVAYDDIPEEEPKLLDDLVLAGILVIDDPVREGVSKAITGVQSAGARVDRHVRRSCTR